MTLPHLWSLLAVAALAAAPHIVRAQSAAAPSAGDSSALEFLGFRAGAPLSDISARLRTLDAGPLKCDRSRVDRRVSECRAILADPDLGGTAELWLSAIDSVSSVLTVAASVEPDQLDAWRGRLERRYGRVGARVQGSQWMMQWVRRSRMIRLTWRVERGQRVASVSLVDGRVLDAWQPAKVPGGKGVRG